MTFRGAYREGYSFYAADCKTLVTCVAGTADNLVQVHVGLRGCFWLLITMHSLHPVALVRLNRKTGWIDCCLQNIIVTVIDSNQTTYSHWLRLTRAADSSQTRRSLESNTRIHLSAAMRPAPDWFTLIGTDIMTEVDFDFRLHFRFLSADYHTCQLICYMLILDN